MRSSGPEWLVTRLPHRLAAMVVIALIPLSVLAIVQTRDIVSRAEEGQLMSAMGQTMQAASPQITMIRGAQTTAQTLASAIVPYVDDPAACRSMIEAGAASIPTASLVAYIPVSGQMTCASGGREHDFSDSPLFQRMIATPEPRFVVNPNAVVSGTSILGISHPVFGANSVQIGVVTISLPHRALTPPEPVSGVRSLVTPDAIITFDGAGVVLTSSVGLDAAASFVPVSRPLAELAGLGYQSFLDEAVFGGRRLFAVVPIAGNLNVLGVWSAAAGPDARRDTYFYLYPLLMCAAGLVVAALAAERLVTRHVRTVSRAMLAFAAGDRSSPMIKLRNPPAEIGSLAAAYRQMTETILQDEAELENLLREKEELLREVHHRTGNSLQLIASILRMHLRETTDDDVREILENVHERVMSLSSVHIGLYRLAGQHDIAMDALVGDVIGKIRQLQERAGRKGAIEAHLEPVVLTSQQAVPLTLLIAELISAFQSFGGAGDAAVRIRLAKAGTHGISLTMSGPASAYPLLTGRAEGAPAGIAARLIRGFVDQLDGKMSVELEDAEARASINFTARGWAAGRDDLSAAQ